MKAITQFRNKLTRPQECVVTITHQGRETGLGLLLRLDYDCQNFTPESRSLLSHARNEVLASDRGFQRGTKGTEADGKSTGLVENFGGAVAEAHHDDIATGLEAMDGGADGIDPNGAEREFAVGAGLEGPAALEAEVPTFR